MFGDIFGKLGEMKQQVEDTKAQLDTISVSGESANGRIKVVCNGNRQIKSISIDDSLRQGDADELTDLLIIALNKALENAEGVNASTMAAATRNLLPPHLMNMLNNS